MYKILALTPSTGKKEGRKEGKGVGREGGREGRRKEGILKLLLFEKQFKKMKPQTID
jgi:hypothetical protein